MKCRFTGTFLYIKLPDITLQKAFVAVLVTVIMKLVSLAGRKCMRTIHVVQMYEDYTCCPNAVFVIPCPTLVLISF